MSKIARKPLILPPGVTVQITGQKFSVSGPKGKLEMDFLPVVKVEASGGTVKTSVIDSSDRRQKSLWGTTHALIRNIVRGVSEGYQKKLEVIGVGYRVDIKTVEEFKKAYEKKKLEAKKQNKPDQELMMEYALGMLDKLSGKAIELQLGFSHPIFLQLPENILVSTEKNVIIISGADRQAVGQFAATVRDQRPPEPYKGKGIKYSDEIIRRKAGKVVKASGG
ncbi:MAG: 50S ribosomal protein L6 [bacterium]|nr:50S ribosomal protein L6 [bacterium]